MERRFKKEINSLEQIFEFIQQFVDKHNLGEDVSFPVSFAVEEIFTNMVKYNPESPHDIRIVLKKKSGDLVVSLTDFDVDEFDVTNSAPVDVSQPLSERKVGGLGLHLVNKFVDDMIYNYEKNNSTITLIKHLG